jgi:hypothetical protein
VQPNEPWSGSASTSLFGRAQSAALATSTAAYTSYLAKMRKLQASRVREDAAPPGFVVLFLPFLGFSIIRRPHFLKILGDAE